MGAPDTFTILCDPDHDSYDPNQLVADVRNLLQSKGLRPNATGHLGVAIGAAGTLLRAFGIAPLGGITTIDRHESHDSDTR
jgi:hypothetical protein